MKIICLAVPVLVMQLFRGHYPVSLFNMGFRCGFVTLRVISLRVLSVPEPLMRFSTSVAACMTASMLMSGISLFSDR